MKIGDKIYCIKSNDTHTENKIYEILEISTTKYDQSALNSIKVTADCTNDFQNYRCYYLYNKYSEWYCFKDYFMSKNEYRKTKLQKLNDKRQ